VLRLVLAGVLAAVLPAVPALAASAAVPSAGDTWHYRADIDGDGAQDAVTISALPGFTVNDYGQGQGQVLVHVDFASGGFAEAYVDSVDYYSVRSPWTPWLGASDLDHRPGKEIVIGTSTGAHAQLFAAYAFRQGELIELSSPLGGDWMINSSFGTGSSGWHCTRHGVEVRAVSAPRSGKVRVTLKSYVLRDSGWKRSGGHVRTVPVNAQGNPPAFTNAFPTFACKGLPHRDL
jgi:hypothetical protein